MATATERRTTVDFADFSVGEYGSLGSWAAPKGSFTAQNVVRYVDGSLGPRNGLKQYTLTGVAASAVQTNGVWLASAFWYQAANETVYYFNTATMTSQAVTSVVTAAELGYQAVTVGENIYMATVADGVREIDAGGGGTDTKATNSPNAWAIAQYGERLVAGGGAATPGRLFYSDAGDPMTWSASNFIDIGVGNYIMALIPLRNALAIVTQYAYAGNLTGYGYRWWLLTGVPGVNDTLREVVQAQGPATFRGATALPNGLVAFTSGLAEGVAFFNGSVTDIVRHLPLGTKGATDTTMVVPLRDENDVLFFGDVSGGSSVSFGYFRRGDTWTKQAFSEANVTDRMSFVPNYTQDLVVFADKTATPKFYAWQPYNDRPPFSGDTFATILDPANVYFELPEWWAKDGEDVAVRKVIVSFKDWDTDDSNANQFDVVVTPVRTFGGASAGGEAATITKSWSRATSASTAAGANLRMDFGIEGSWGNGFKLKIANMRGVAIQKIQVVLHARPVAGL